MGIMSTRSRFAGVFVSSGVILGLISPGHAEEKGPSAAPAKAGQVTKSDTAVEPPPPAKDGKWSLMLGIIPLSASVNFHEKDAFGRKRIRHHVGASSVQPIVSYDSSTFFLGARYRFYGGFHPYTKKNGYEQYFGELNFAQYAYAGIKMTTRDSVTLGLQQVPFGITPFFSSSFIETIGNQVGLEDVYNIGVKYERKDEKYKISLGYFPVDGGNYHGISVDSARYSPNIVRADPHVVGGSHNSERHMFVARGEYTVYKTPEASAMVGGSVWFSGVYNNDTRDYGFKKQVAAHFVGTYRDWTFMAVGARVDIDPKNPYGRNDTVTMGLFDGSFNVATHGTFISGEVSYKYKPQSGLFSEIQPYLGYAAYYKDKSAFRDSERAVGGAGWTLRAVPNIQVFTEYRFGKNDPYTGAGQMTQALAAGGDNKWKSSASFIVTWYLPLL